MRLSDALGILFVGFAYAQWAIVGRYTGAPAIWVGMIVMVTAIGAMMTFSWKELLSASMPQPAMIGLLVIAGILNGVAIAVQTNIMADKTLPVSSGVVLTTMFALMIALAPLLSYLINGDPISLVQAGGVALILAGIVVLAL